MDKEEIYKIKKAIRLIYYGEKREGLNVLAEIVGWPKDDKAFQDSKLLKGDQDD